MMMFESICNSLQNNREICRFFLRAKFSTIRKFIQSKKHSFIHSFIHTFNKHQFLQSNMYTVKKLIVEFQHSAVLVNFCEINNKAR